MIDFATTESPYRDANKGWVTDDVYVQWGKDPKQNSKTGVEFANVSIFWTPINQIASILLTVVLFAATFVFLTVSLAHGKLQISAFTANESLEQADAFETQVELQQSEELDLDMASSIAQVPAAKIEREFELEATAQSQAAFAAAALGGKPIQR